MNFINAEMILYVLMRCFIPAAVFGYHGIGKSSLPWQLMKRRRKELGQPYEHIDTTSKGASRFHNENGLFGCWQWDIPVSEKDEAIGFGVTVNLIDMALQAATKNGETGNLKTRVNSVLDDLRGIYWKRYPENEGRDIFVVYVRNHKFIPPPTHKGGGIWALEELNRDQSGLRGPICQIGLSGGFLDHVNPPDIWMYASMNPPDGDYEVTPLDEAMMNRFALMQVRSDKESWVEWAVRCGTKREIIESVVANEAEVFNPHEKGFELPKRVCASRNIGDLNTVVNFLESEDGQRLGMPAEMIQATYITIVGESAAALIYNDLTNPDRERAVAGEAVLEEYGWEPGKGGWDSYYDGIDHSGDDEPGRDNSKLAMGEHRLRVRAMSGLGDKAKKKFELGMLSITNTYLMAWLVNLHDRLKKNEKPSNRDFRGWMNFCLYANDLPDDLRAGLLTNHTMMNVVRKTIEKFSEMAYDRNEELNDALMHRGNVELGQRLVEAEDRLSKDKAA